MALSRNPFNGFKVAGYCFLALACIAPAFSAIRELVTAKNLAPVLILAIADFLSGLTTPLSIGLILMSCAFFWGARPPKPVSEKARS